jgi:UDP-glucose 4-epimerase
VLEVIDTVKRASGLDFKVVFAGRRVGDPSAIVADASRIRSLLGFTPKYDDLSTIAQHALTGEQRRVAVGAGAA